MMDTCKAPLCNKSKHKHPTLTFFEFPKDQARLKKWLSNAGLQELMDGKEKGSNYSYSLCENHFEKNCIKGKKKKMLKADAVPTLFNLDDKNMRNSNKININQALDDWSSRLNTATEQLFKLLPNQFSEVYDVRKSKNDQAEIRQFKNAEVQTDGLAKGSDVEEKPELLSYSKHSNSKMHLLCRLCSSLIDRSNAVEIYSDSGKERSIDKMINKFLPNQVKANDGMPQQICLPCVEKLEHCDKVVKSFAAADQKLKNLLTTPLTRKRKPIQEPTKQVKKQKRQSSGSTDTLNSWKLEEKEPVIDKEVSSNTPAKIDNSALNGKTGVPIDESVPEEEQISNNLGNADSVNKTLQDSNEKLSVKGNIDKSKSPSQSLNDSLKCVSCGLTFHQKCDVSLHKQTEHPKSVPTLVKEKSMSSEVKKIIEEKSVTERLNHNCVKCSTNFQNEYSLFIHKRICYQDLKESKLKRDSEKSLQNNTTKLVKKKMPTIKLDKRISRRVLKLPPKFKHLEKSEESDLSDSKETPPPRKRVSRKLDTKKGEKTSSVDKGSSSDLPVKKQLKDRNAFQQKSSNRELEAHPSVTEEDEDFSSDTERLNDSDYDITEESSESWTSNNNNKILNKQDIDAAAADDNDEEKCTCCGARYSDKSDLIFHISTHWKYNCLECGKKYKRCADMKKHSYLVHNNNASDSDDYQFVFCCDFCGKQLNKLILIQSHMKEHTAPLFSCNLCNKEFDSKTTFMSHIQAHFDECPYFCCICENRFHTSISLRNHMKTHTTEKCSYCFKDFADNNSLDRHVEEIHIQSRSKQSGIIGSTEAVDLCEEGTDNQHKDNDDRGANESCSALNKSSADDETRDFVEQNNPQTKTLIQNDTVEEYDQLCDLKNQSDISDSTTLFKESENVSHKPPVKIYSSVSPPEISSNNSIAFQGNSIKELNSVKQGDEKIDVGGENTIVCVDHTKDKSEVSEKEEIICEPNIAMYDLKSESIVPEKEPIESTELESVQNKIIKSTIVTNVCINSDEGTEDEPFTLQERANVQESLETLKVDDEDLSREMDIENVKTANPQTEYKIESPLCDMESSDSSQGSSCNNTDDVENPENISSPIPTTMEVEDLKMDDDLAQPNEFIDRKEDDTLPSLDDDLDNSSKSACDENEIEHDKSAVADTMIVDSLTNKTQEEECQESIKLISDSNLKNSERILPSSESHSDEMQIDDETRDSTSSLHLVQDEQSRESSLQNVHDVCISNTGSPDKCNDSEAIISNLHTTSEDEHSQQHDSLEMLMSVSQEKEENPSDDGNILHSENSNTDNLKVDEQSQKQESLEDLLEEDEFHNDCERFLPESKSSLLISDSIRKEINCEDHLISVQDVMLMEQESISNASGNNIMEDSANEDLNPTTTTALEEISTLSTVETPEANKELPQGSASEVDMPLLSSTFESQPDELKISKLEDPNSAEEEELKNAELAEKSKNFDL